MRTIGIASVTGAPGVTTLSLALSYTLPGSSLVLEADTSKASSVLAGYFQGTQPANRGLLELAFRSQQHVLTDQDYWEQVLRLDDDEQYVIPGLIDPTSARGIDSVIWSRLGVWLSTLSPAITPIIDFGRLTPHDPRASLLESVDHLAIAITPTLPDVLAAQSALGYLRELIPMSKRENCLGLVLVAKPGIQNYSAREITSRLHVPVWAEIPHEPKLAMAFSHHTRDLPARGPENKLVRKSSLLRHVHMLTTALEDRENALAEVVEFEEGEEAHA